MRGNGVTRAVPAAVALIILFASTAFAAEFQASSRSKKYHRPSCKWAQKIKPDNLITFKSPEEAAEAGYVPCKSCKPPESSRPEADDGDDEETAQPGQ